MSCRKFFSCQFFCAFHRVNFILPSDKPVNMPVVDKVGETSGKSTKHTRCYYPKDKKLIQTFLKASSINCSNCGQVISKEDREKIKNIIDFTESELEKMGNVAYLDICRVCLKKQEKFLYTSNIYKVKILDLAMESSIILKNWQSALCYGKQLLQPFKKYYGERHPIRGIFLMKLGKISLLLENKNDARKYFEEAAAILKITHGSKHVLIKEELYDYIGQCL